MAGQRLSCLWPFILISLSLVSNGAAWARPAPDNKNNGTITEESDGSHVWCESSQWYDVLWFFFANFLLHALSVRSLPGESYVSSTVFKFCCLLVPYTGVRRGLCLILRASNLAGNDLESAARANALCMVIRGPEWRPRDGQIVEGCTIAPPKEQRKKRNKKGTTVSRALSSFFLLDGNRNKIKKSGKSEKSSAPEITIIDTNTSADSPVQSPIQGNEVVLKTKDLYAPPPARRLIDKLTKVLIETHRFHSQPPTTNLVDHVNVKIHGVCQLTPGYALAYIPEDMKVYSHIKHQRSLSISRILGVSHAPDIKLASTHDVPRILFSIIQTVFGAYTLYKARGTQIERYGYAAFGLTVLPYMMVSVINLVGSLLSSEYETVYLVHSAIMDEMKLRGGLCDGVVGTLERPSHQTYVHVEGETETNSSGQSIEFGYSGGELHGHDAAEGVSPTELHVAATNDIDPVKYIYPSQNWRQAWRNVRKKKESPPSRRLLCVPSHSGFTRLPPLWYQTCLKMLTIVLLILALGLPYIIIAILSGWRLGRSTSMQRTFVTNWYICGQVHGYGVSVVEGVDGKKNVVRSFIIIFVTYGAYCIMGFYVVAQEMLESGTCKAL
ncbi:MAG: hypothetical protein L6R40_006791 [Gallowayella cf. fulva]|nr:MAG: hypothetical protein L6R40_006791 [Xanthomendoza cf. fulva]